MSELDSARRKLDMGDNSGAMRDVALFLKTNPRNLEGWFLLAEILDDPQKKRDCYRQVLNIDPGNPIAESAIYALDHPQAVEPEIHEEPVLPDISLDRLDRLERDFGATPPAQPPVPVIQPRPVEPAAPTPPAPIPPAPKAEEPAQPPEPTVYDYPFAPTEASGEVKAAPLTRRLAEPEDTYIPPAEDLDRGEFGEERSPRGRKNRSIGKFIRNLFLTLIVLGGLAFIVYRGGSMFSKLLPATPTPMPPSATPNLTIEPTITLKPSWTPLVSNTPGPTNTPTPTLSATLAVPSHFSMFYIQGAKLWQYTGGVSTMLVESAVDTEQIEFSPDGRTAALIFNHSLWLVNRDGTNLTELVPSEAIVPSNPPGELLTAKYSPYRLDWSPDGRTIYFTNIVATDVGDMTADDLYSVNVATGEVTSMLNYLEGGIPIVSPDGKFIALVSATHVSMVSSDGEDLVEMLTFINTTSAENQGSYFIPPVAWIPDSSGFITATQPDENDEFGTWATYRISTRDGTMTSLGNFITLGGIFRLAPDGQNVIYQLVTGLGEAPYDELHMASVDNKVDEILLGDTMAEFYGWVPNNSGDFVFRAQSDGKFYIGNPSVELNRPLFGQAIPEGEVRGLYWINETQFVLRIEADLYLCEIGGEVVPLVTGGPTTLYELDATD